MKHFWFWLGSRLVACGSGKDENEARQQIKEFACIHKQIGETPSEFCRILDYSIVKTY